MTKEKLLESLKSFESLLEQEVAHLQKYENEGRNLLATQSRVYIKQLQEKIEEINFCLTLF